MRRAILSCLSGLALCAACGPVWGFDGDEHTRVSNQALKLNLKILDASIQGLQPGSPDRDRLQQAHRVLESLLQPAAGLPDYGTLVASVDHYSIVGEKGFAGFEFFLDCKRVQIGMAKGNPCKWTAWPRHLLAVHTNDLHFQGGAQKGIQYFHQEAIKAAAEASDEDGIRKAFLLNALTDHLIQDFLAPGHVATPRSNFHDVPSAIIHDTYNGSGLLFRFRVDSSGWQALRELADSVAQLPGKDESLTKLSENFGSFIRKAQADPEHLQTFRGDSLLACNDAQELYMLLLTTRSNRDLVESFLDRRPVDKVESSHWDWIPPLADHEVDDPKDLQGKVNLPTAATSSGEYKLGDIITPYTSQDGFKIRGLMGSFSRPSGSSASFMIDLDRILQTAIPRGAIKLSENGKPTDKDAVKNAMWQFFAFGVSYARSPGLNAYDGHFSGFWPLGRSQDWTMSMRVGLGSYRHAGERNLRLNGGLGIGRGFGLAYGEFRFDRSYVARSGGRLHGRWAPSLGLRAMLPMTWTDRLYRFVFRKPPPCSQDAAR